MKINFNKQGLLITGIAVLTLLFIVSCSATPATKKPASINQVNEDEVRARRERIQAQEKAREEEREARKVRGTINLHSDYSGTVLINGEETQFKAITENEVRIIIENAVGNEYTLAVRDSAGIVHSFGSKILIERGVDETEEIFIYNASIINTSPNVPEDFDVVQNINGITITSYKGTRKRVIIPETLHGQKVTVIGDNAFEGKGIVSVVIPNSIVTIGKDVFTKGFRSSSIENEINEVIIPDSVTSIGSNAFYKCGLTKVTIGRGVQFIGYEAFDGNKISELVVFAPFTTYDRKKTGIERVPGIGLVDTYSQTLGLHPRAFDFFSKLESLTRITLPANIHDGNLEAFPQGLAGFYKSQGKRAGTYVLNGPVWARE